MNRFRFYVAGHGYTDWEDERVKHGIGAPHTAPARLTELRREYPEAAISIEREGENRRPNQLAQFRFQIKLPNDEVRYSRLISEDERDERLREIQEMFPKGEISEVKF